MRLAGASGTLGAPSDALGAPSDALGAPSDALGAPCDIMEIMDIRTSWTSMGEDTKIYMDIYLLSMIF